ncbi:hypothetical protein OIU80_09495 [Flavobacterium sp. LS1R47]|uniref:Uncharacterized protein n=1 Tax=Flavobacterium frigoritolerans TaxID=2987686 RepID=A0A9X3C1J7_9FLAO|nr:hypothetical protein [Flavobacterium frigoritolerans]MCV9932516.1 hypothetical protein [Flavobacterium frigoritolerans]
MISSIKLIITKLASKPKNIFLLDSIGAFITAFLLGFVLAKFQDAFGMPQTILYFLSALALVFAIYSSCCYYYVTTKWRSYLYPIMIANVLYCCLTSGLLIYYFHKLTILGLIYFILEISIIICLVVIERKVQRDRVTK